MANGHHSAMEVLQPGFLTTVQDLGRFGYQRFGIPTSGAMDPFALRAANALAGNEPGTAALEITLAGPVLRFTRLCVVAMAGADLSPRMDGREVPNWVSVLVRPGSVLGFPGRRSGARAYLAVSGGIAVPPWLGSRATYLAGGAGGHEGRPLRAGDLLPIGAGEGMPRLKAGVSLAAEGEPSYSPEPTLRVMLGPHADRFGSRQIRQFLGSSYRIGATSNRMGYRLEGSKISPEGGSDVISCGIPLGAVQVPADGQPVLLLADRQTTGGYAMIATVIQADIPLAAQCLPGDLLRFSAVGPEDARAALLRQEAALRVDGREREDLAGWAM